MNLKRCAMTLMLLLAVTGASHLRGEAVEPTRIAPETTQAFLKIRDVSQLETDWKQTGLYRLWSDPQTQQFFKPLMDLLSADLDTPATQEATASILGGWNAFKELFPGEVAIFVSDVDLLNTGGFVLDLCIAGKAGKEHKDYETLHSLLWSQMPADAEKTTFDVAGVTVYQVRFPNEMADAVLPADRAGLSAETIERARFTTLQSAMVDDWYILVDGSANSMRNIIQRHQGNLTNTLGQASRFQQAMQPLDSNGHLSLYLGLGAVLSDLVEVFQHHANANPGMSLNLAGLGVDELESLALSISFDANRMRGDSTIVRKANSQGLGKLLDFYGTSCEFKTARFTAEDVLGYSAFAYDLAAAWDAIEGMARRVSPEVGMQLDAVLGMAQMQLGFNPINDIVRNLAGESASITPRSGPAPDAVPGMMQTLSSPFVFMLETKNGAQIQAAIEKIEQTFLQETTMQGGPAPESPIEKSEFLDFTIQTIKAPEMGMGMAMATFPAWTITDTWVIVGSNPDELRNVLRRVAGREERHFAATQAFQDAMAKAGDRPLAGMSYTDVPEMINDSLNQLQGLLFTATMLSGGALPPNILDFQARPDLATLKQRLGPAVSLMWKSPTVITNVSVLETK